MGNYYQYNYSRNLRFYHHSEQASESALVETNSDEIEKRPGGVPKMLNKISEDSLSTQMKRLYESLLPTKESAQKREAFARKIEKILNEEWPGHDIEVHMFGSSMNDLGTTQSDVDLCVTTQWDGLKNIFVLSEFLKKHDMRIEQTVSKAKVPIVRLFDPNLDLACDINVNNTLALHNTRLIQRYVCIDPRVRPLAMVVKYWARRRVLNDAAKGGTISTYTWTCIILNFLQMRNPPILPVLHKLPHEGVKPIIVNNEDASFCEDIENLKTFGKQNNESLGGLLFAFFRHMAFEFDYDNHVISLRQGKYLTKAEKGWDTCKGWKMLCVEEPFNTARNLGNSADDISVNGLKQEFRRAYDILYESANLESLCEEYRFQYNNNFHHYNHYNHYNHNKNYNYNRGYHHNYKSNKRNLRTSSTGHVKSGNRNPCMKPHNGQQNEQTTDNFHYSQDNEEDRSSMPRFHVDNVSQNGHYSTINGSGIAPVSDVDHVKRDHNTFPTRKPFDDYQKRERNGFVSPTMRHAEVNDSQIQHHNVSLNLREDEQLLHSHPQIKNVKNNVHRQGFTKRKNDERPSYSDQSNNYVRQSQDSDPSAYKSSQDTSSNQNQTNKNNNQKVDNNWNRSRPSYSDQKSGYSQNANASYGSDNKHNYSRRHNTSNDLDQRTSVAYNYRQKSNKQDYNNSRQVEDSNSSSIISSRSKPSSSIVDDSSNLDRSNPAQMPSPKPTYRSNNHHKNNGKQHTHFNSKPPQQFQKPAENFDFANNAYSPYSMLPHNVVMVSMSTDSIYPTNHNNGFLSSQNTIPAFTPTFQNHHGQLNDGTTNYLRRNSHQSSSDGSNSQTSGNTSNTSYSNSSSNYTKHSNQKNNGNNSNQNQNNYHQQPRQNKPNNNNFNRKKRNNNNNNNNNNYNYTNGNNGYINGNYRPNNTASNSFPAVAPHVNDPTFNYHEDPIISNLNISPQMNQGHHSMSKVGNDYNGDTNGKVYNNLKGYNSNNSNSLKNSNTRIINGSNNNTNGPKSTNGGNNSSNRNVNSSNSNSNNNYSRSNGNNYNNNNYNSNNLHKSVNGNNQNVSKTVDVNNNYNAQTKNVNNNHSNSIKNGGNNNSGNTNVQRNNSERYYCNKSNRNNKNMRRNSNANFKVEKKEDGFNYQQQYSQEIQLSSSRQNNYNIQSHQQNNSHQQESSSKPKNVQKKKVGQKRNMHKEFQQQQFQQQRFQQQQ